MIHKHFLPFSGLPFYSFDTVFPCAKFLNFMKFNLSIFFFCCLRLWCHCPSRQKVPVCVFKEDFHFYLRSMLPILLLPRIEIMVNGHFISEFILDTTLLVARYSCSFKRCSPWQATSGL